MKRNNQKIVILLALFTLLSFFFSFFFLSEKCNLSPVYTLILVCMAVKRNALLTRLRVTFKEMLNGSGINEVKVYLHQINSNSSDFRQTCFSHQALLDRLPSSISVAFFLSIFPPNLGLYLYHLSKFA